MRGCRAREILLNHRCMRPPGGLLPLLLVVLAVGAHAADLPAGAEFEKLPLVPAEGAKVWSPAESTITASTARVKVGGSSWHWAIAVDHTAGEARYPIGWPRASHAIAVGPLRDWSGWDFLHAWIYAETSRAALPREPLGLGLHTPDRANAFNRALGDVRKDAWQEIIIPLSEIPRHNDVRQIQFHIAESNYAHGDRVDFYLHDLALLRYAAPTLLQFAAESAVAFADAREIAATFQLTGVKPGARVEMTCELRREGAAPVRVVRQLGRGPQRLALDLRREKLTAGNYELSAQITGQPANARVAVRLVDSPWR